MHDTPTSNIADVRILLYGDVNLNVMDGSAIWLPSLAETLSLTGAQVHVQLKAVETRDLLSGPLRRLSGVTVHDAPVAEAEDAMERGQAAEALEALDAALDFDVLLVRGSEMCLEIVERGTFEGRLWSYVTESGISAEDSLMISSVGSIGWLREVGSCWPRRSTRGRSLRLSCPQLRVAPSYCPR